MSFDSLDETKLLRRYYEAQWIRPESAIWDTYAAQLLNREARSQCTSRVDFGCGNGNFTFLASEGEFEFDYDWYHHVNTSGFKDNSDIYDHRSSFETSKMVRVEPQIKWRLGVDQKENLLAQARQIKLYKDTVQADGNEPLDSVFPKNERVELIFSNILYWLRSPLDVLARLEKHLTPEGRIVLMFPNPKFQEYCKSYSWKSTGSELLRLLNRGRSDSLQWTLDLDEFAKQLAARTQLKITHSETYLSQSCLEFWDIGLRPLSPALIDHLGRISPLERNRFKKEWVESTWNLIHEFYRHEKSEISRNQGGFNFAVLKLK